MSLKLATLNGTNGFRLDGERFDRSGRSVASAGDVNGDGIDDLIIGASFAQPSGRQWAGSSYVVFGHAGGFAPTLELSTLDGTDGFRLDGAAENDRSGNSVASAGDVNGDGFDDLIVGAQLADPSGRYNAGSSYVVFGRAGGFAPTLELSTLNGADGFRLDGAGAGDSSGNSVASAGDVNGDGIDDLIVGAFGKSYVVFGRAGGFAPTLNLSTLDGTDGFRLDGAAAGDFSGSSVASAGDVNGDGFDDLIVGAAGADPAGRVNAGSSYVVFGRAEGFAATLDLGALDGTDGFRLDGAAENDRSGHSVASAGDVNGDGFDDLIVGASWADPSGRSSAGSSYVVFGRAGGFAPTLELSALDGTNGFRLDGAAAGDSSGNSVASAGDVNGDGFDDLIVGASGADPSGRGGAGSSYVVFGRANGFAATLDLGALTPAEGFRLDGAASEDRSGDAVSSAGDVNGDGFDDLIVGAPGADPSGRFGAGSSYVVFGSAALGGANDPPVAADDAVVAIPGDVVNLIDGSVGDADLDANFDALSIVAIDGAAVARGDSVALASGLRVTVVGAETVRFDAPGIAFGTVIDTSFTYRVGDGRGGFSDATVSVQFSQYILDLGAMTPTDGFRLDGAAAGDFSGLSVASAGDVNGDGFDDLIVGAPWADPFGRYNAGSSYVVFGRAEGFAPTLELSALDGTDGFRLDGAAAGDNSGISVASAGDVNGDGIDDLIIGARGASPAGRSGAGSSYVVFGRAEGFEATLELSALDGTDGFRLDGVNGAGAGDYSGRSVASAGDVNGDGVDDLIVGAYYASPAGRFGAGSSYVVFGRAEGFAATLDLGALDGTDGFRLDGAGGSDRSGYSVASAGDVNGDGFDDLIVGAFFADPSGSSAAKSSYVVFGSAGGFAATLDLGALDGTDGFRLNGAGNSVASAGDVNGDGFDDLIVGARWVLHEYSVEIDRSYVVFGRAGGFAATLSLGALDGTNGFRLDGAAFDRTGDSVASAGDVNGDGFDDLIVGAWGADPSGRGNAGSSYVVFGRAGGFRSSLDLGALTPADGFRLDGAAAGDGSGRSVASAGDVNGDGFDDLIVGAPSADPSGRTSAGSSYVVFGSRLAIDPTIAGDTALAVAEGGTVALTREDLRAVDLQSLPAALSFTVAATTAGFLARAAAPTAPIAAFTQAEIDAGDILFVHDDSEGAAAGFAVTLTDGDGNTAGPRTVDVAVSPVNDAPVFVSAVDANLVPGEVAAFLLTAADADGDGLSFSVAVTDDLTGAPVDPSAWTLTDNGDGTARFAWTDEAARDGLYTAVITVDDGALAASTAILFDGSTVFEDPSPRLIVRAGGMGGPILSPVLDVYVDGVLIGSESIVDPLLEGRFLRGRDDSYRDYTFLVPDDIAGKDVAIRFGNDGRDPETGRDLNLFIQSVTLDGLTLSAGSFGYYLADRPGPQPGRSGFGKAMYWDGVTVFADIEAKEAHGVIEVIAAGVGAPGVGPAFSVFADGRKLGYVTAPDPVDADGRPIDAAFDSFRFALPKGLDPNELRIVYKQPIGAAEIDPALWVDAIVVNGTRLEAEEDGFFVPCSFSDGGFGPREDLLTSGALVFADLL